MGQPAARVIIDTGAHSAPILPPGSLNVLIEGFPAARQGDKIICPLVSASPPHPPAIITGGSTSVFINGIPAARKGDITVCGAPPPTTVVGPPIAPGGIVCGGGSNEQKKSKKEKIDSFTIGDTTVTKTTTVEVGSIEPEICIIDGNRQFGVVLKAESTTVSNKESASYTSGDTNVTVTKYDKSPGIKVRNEGYIVNDGHKRGFLIDVASGASAGSQGVDLLLKNEKEFLNLGFEMSQGFGIDGAFGVIHDTDSGMVYTKVRVPVDFISIGFEFNLNEDRLKNMKFSFVDISMFDILMKINPIPAPIPGTILTGSPSVLIGG